MRNLTDWAATLRHSHSSFPDDLRDEIDRHNERIVGLIRAEGFKAGQEAMRQAILIENVRKAVVDTINALPIEEPK